MVKGYLRILELACLRLFLRTFRGLDGFQSDTHIHLSLKFLIHEFIDALVPPFSPDFVFIDHRLRIGRGKFRLSNMQQAASCSIKACLLLRRSLLVRRGHRLLGDVVSEEDLIVEMSWLT